MTIAPSRMLTATLRTLSLGIGGGLLFFLLGLPLPWLLGALCVTSATSLAGLKPTVDVRLRTLAHLVLGVMIGSAFSPGLLERAGQWLLSLSGMMLFLAVVTPLSIAYCRRVMGLDATTSTFAGMPGGLSEMVISSSFLGADARAVGIVHTTRLALIVLTVPVAIDLVGGTPLSAVNAGIGSNGADWADAFILSTCGVLGALLGQALRLPTPALLGSLVLSAAAHLSGVTAARPPGWLLAGVQVFIGTYVGSQLGGLSRSELSRMVGLAAALTFGLLLVTLLFAIALSTVTGFRPLALFLAFVPGGIAEMALIALLLDVDPVFVATHHTLRVIVLLPLSRVLRAHWRKQTETGC